jgi:hypothetical protein
MNGVQSALSSPRFSRILFWLGAAVLAAGLAVLIVKLASRGSSHPVVIKPPSSAHLSGQSAKDQQLLAQSTIKSYAKVDPLAKQALRTFIISAVARKNLGASYKVAAPAIRHGYTLAKWKRGTLPVPVYPVYKFDKTADFRLAFGNSTDLLIDVHVVAAPKEKQKPATFRVGLKRFGSGADRRWLVNYLLPIYTPLLPSAQ